MMRALLRAAPTGCLLTVVFAATLVGQQLSPEEHVESWEQRYRIALDGYRAAESEFDSVNSLWIELENEYEAAQAADDEDRMRSFLARFQDLSGRRDRAESALLAHRDTLYEAGDGLISAIDAGLDQLVAQLEHGPEGSGFETYRRYARLDTLLQSVVREQSDLGDRSPTLPPMSVIEIREGDTRDDILYKANVLEDRADRLEGVVDLLDEEIEVLTNRQRRERVSAGVRARFERFGDNTLPVTTGTDAAGVTGEGGVAANLGLTLEERIARLEGTKEDVVERIGQLRDKAREFRERAGEIL